MVCASLLCSDSPPRLDPPLPTVFFLPSAIDIANGAVVMLRSHARGVSLAALNLTQHLAAAGSGDDGVRYALPAASRNDGLLRAKAEAAAAAAAAARRRGDQ